VIVWQDEADLELWRRAGQRITAWQHLDADPTALAQHLAVAALAASSPLRAVLINGSTELRAELQAAALSEIELATRETRPIAEHAALQADAVLRGEAPWIELRRGELASGDPYRNVRRSLRLVMAAAAVFLITLTGVFFAKDWRQRNELARLTQQQAEAFRQAFPSARVPAAVVARMRSEHAKLQASRTAAKEVKPPTPALRVLVELLHALPAGEPFAVRELRIEDGQIDLDVHLRQHAGVNQIVESLEARGFAVSAPATARQDDASVSCRIFGELQLAGAQRAEEQP
jgi:type II secretory pathway component PulL